MHDLEAPQAFAQHGSGHRFPEWQVCVEPHPAGPLPPTRVPGDDANRERDAGERPARHLVSGTGASSVPKRARVAAWVQKWYNVIIAVAAIEGDAENDNTYAPAVPAHQETIPGYHRSFPSLRLL